MSANKKRQIRQSLLGVGLGLILAGCSSSNNPPSSSVAAPPATVTIGGAVADGPVAGGTLFVFAPSQVQVALATVDPEGDRRAALVAAGPIATLNRDSADEGEFVLPISGASADSMVFLIFDNADAEDLEFHDTPPNLESVVLLGAAGTTQRVNVSTHTTLISQQVRAQLDPDGDGTIIAAGAVQSAAQAAEMSVLDALGEDDQGRDLYPSGASPISTDDDDMIDSASSYVGLLARMIASVEGIDLDEAMAALAADAGDGDIDGSIPAFLNPSDELEALAEASADFESRGSDDDIAMFAVGPCSSSAVSMARACAADIIDNSFESRAFCADFEDEATREDCLADLGLEEEEGEEECDDVFEARLELCESLADAAHEPSFGPIFTSNFVDPRDIGGAVTANPFFPLVAGNRWTYEGDGETIVVEVQDEIKLIQGIPCVVVNDVVSEEGILIENTDDWYGQDVDGNVWYCGEIAENYELFDGDDPEEAELVDTDGSWKAGRDGAEPGILIPSMPVPGDVIRQEVLYGEAEDAIEIVSITATETSPGGSCAGNCLQTSDFTPLEPDTLESKYYAPGIGVILEVDEETGDRVELMLFEAG